MAAVAVALRPEHYGRGEDDEGDDEDDPDDPWVICDEEFARLPAALVGQDEEAHLEMWRWSRGGQFGGVGHLPEAGGVLDQSPRNLTVLRFMNSVAHWLDKHVKPPRPSKPGGKA